MNQGRQRKAARKDSICKKGFCGFEFTTTEKLGACIECGIQGTLLKGNSWKAAPGIINSLALWAMFGVSTLSPDRILRQMEVCAESRS